jgi:hypothetical protein
MEVPQWFSESQPATYSETTKKLLSITAVEQQIKKRFPKIQPMIPEMVEFLAQTTSPHDKTPPYHPDNLLGN